MNRSVLKRMEVLGLNDTEARIEYKETVSKLDMLLIKAQQMSKDLEDKIKGFENNRAIAIRVNVINDIQLKELDSKILSLKSKKCAIDNKIHEIILELNKNKVE